MAPPGCQGARRLTAAVAGRAIVRVEHPVRLGRRSEPQPDIALLRHRGDFYRGGHPGPKDVLLVVEVGDGSVAFDREVETPLYAAVGSPRSGCSKSIAALEPARTPRSGVTSAVDRLAPAMLQHVAVDGSAVPG